MADHKHINQTADTYQWWLDNQTTLAYYIPDHKHINQTVQQGNRDAWWNFISTERGHTTVEYTETTTQAEYILEGKECAALW